MNSMRSELQQTEEKTISLERLTDHITGLNDQFKKEEVEKMRSEGLLYTYDDFDKVSELHIDKVNATIPPIDKEVEQDFEDTWSSLTADLFTNLKDDLKS
jgi:hypothetical protein